MNGQPHDSDSPEIPGEIGRYRIVRKIGAGAFADVYLGCDALLGVEVALKVIRSEVAESREIEGARIMSRLQHPNIVRVRSAERADGKLIIAMDYVDGKTLKQVVDEHGPLDLPQAISIACAIASALEYVHGFSCEDGGNLAHLDLKPSNILIDSCGLVRITDFGVAQALGQLTWERAASVQGSPAYMAPEQFDGAPVQQSDIWATGVLLHYMLLGDTPFHGVSVEDYRARLCGQEAECGRGVDGLPEAVRPVIASCLQRDLDKRFATASDLLAALQKIASSRKCPKCGAEIPAGNDICAECTLNSRGTASTPAVWQCAAGGVTGHRRRLWWLYVGMVLLTALSGYHLYRFAGRLWPRNDRPATIEVVRRSSPEKGSASVRPDVRTPDLEKLEWSRILALEKSPAGSYQDRIRSLRDFLDKYPRSSQAIAARDKLDAWQQEERWFQDASVLEYAAGVRMSIILRSWQDFHQNQATGFRRAHAWERILYWSSQIEHYTGYAELAIRSASGLPPSDNEPLGAALPDPYIVIMDGKKVIYRSRPQENISSPVWDERTRIYLSPDRYPVLEIRDDDPVGYDLLLRYEMSDLPPDGAFKIAVGYVQASLEIQRER